MTQEGPDLKAYMMAGVALGLVCLVSYVSLFSDDWRSLFEQRAWASIDALLSGVWGAQ